jgi:hypothetical protein
MQLQKSTKHINNHDFNIHNINIDNNNGARPPLPPHLNGDNVNEGQGLRRRVYGSNFDDNGPK